MQGEKRRSQCENCISLLVLVHSSSIVEIHGGSRDTKDVRDLNVPDINSAGIEAANVTSIISEAWVLIEAVSVVEAHVVGAVGGEGGVLGGSH